MNSVEIPLDVKQPLQNRPLQDGVINSVFSLSERSVSGTSMPRGRRKIHQVCLQDWVWNRPSDRSPCFAQELPRPYVRTVVAALFQRVLEMRANVIVVSNHHINHTFMN